VPAVGPSSRTRVPATATTRRERRRASQAAHPWRSRPLQILTILIVLGLLIVAALTFFDTNGGGDGGRPETKVRTVSADLELVRGAYSNENAGPPADLSIEIQDRLMEVIGTYVDKGVVVPLQEGDRPPLERLLRLFDAGAAQRLLTTPDADVVFETTGVEMTIEKAKAREPVFFTGLSDGSGTFVLVTATFGIELAGRTDDGNLTVSRSWELTFVPEGSDWKITGYDAGVIRLGPGARGTAPTSTASNT
jgi:hypothetical protein